MDFQFHGTPSRRDSRGMPSTRASIRIRYSPSAGSSERGAMLNPQFPASAVVTPCNGEGVRAPSQKTWASKCVWTSMNPGVNQLAAGVDRNPGRIAHRTDLDDPVALYGDIGPACRSPRPVDDRSA